MKNQGLLSLALSSTPAGKIVEGMSPCVTSTQKGTPVPLIKAVSENFNSTTLAVALCNAAAPCRTRFPVRGHSWAKLSESERYEIIDVCQQALDDLASQKILSVEEGPFS
jgi:hypothetical protein